MKAFAGGEKIVFKTRDKRLPVIGGVDLFAVRTGYGVPYAEFARLHRKRRLAVVQERFAGIRGEKQYGHADRGTYPGVVEALRLLAGKNPRIRQAVAYAQPVRTPREREVPALESMSFDKARKLFSRLQLGKRRTKLLYGFVALFGKLTVVITFHGGA